VECGIDSPGGGRELFTAQLTLLQQMMVLPAQGWKFVPWNESFLRSYNYCCRQSTRQHFFNKLLDTVTLNFIYYVVFQYSCHLFACIHSSILVSVALKFRSLLLAVFYYF